MKIQDSEKLKIMEEQLWGYKKNIVGIDFIIRYNEGIKIKNPNRAKEVDERRMQLETDRRQIIRYAEKIQKEINEIKLKPIEEDLKKNQKQDGGDK